MDAMNRNQTLNMNNSLHNGTHVSEAAAQLLHDGKVLANEIYEEGINRVNAAEDSIKEYSDQLLNKVKEKPLAAILIAGGIGFLLSKILK